jgi:hypothetical protein
MKTLVAQSSTASGRAAPHKGLIWIEEQIREENPSFRQGKTTFDQEHIESLAAEREVHEHIADTERSP